MNTLLVLEWVVWMRQWESVKFVSTSIMKLVHLSTQYVYTLVTYIPHVAVHSCTCLSFLPLLHDCDVRGPWNQKNLAARQMKRCTIQSWPCIARIFKTNLSFCLFNLKQFRGWVYKCSSTVHNMLTLTIPLPALDAFCFRAVARYLAHLCCPFLSAKSRGVLPSMSVRDASVPWSQRTWMILWEECKCTRAWKVL